MYYFPQSDLLYDPLKNTYFRFEQAVAENQDEAKSMGKLVPVADGSTIDFAVSLDELKKKPSIGIDVATGARYAFWKQDGVLHRVGFSRQLGDKKDTDDQLLQFTGAALPLENNSWGIQKPLPIEGTTSDERIANRARIITALSKHEKIAAWMTGQLPLDSASKLKDMNNAIEVVAKAPAAGKPSYEEMNKNMPDYDPVTVPSADTNHWDRNLGPYINLALNEARKSLLKAMIDEMPNDTTTINTDAFKTKFADEFKTRLLNIYRAAIASDAVINAADNTIIQQLRGELLWAESVVGLYSSISPNIHFDNAYAISVAAIQARISQIAPEVSIDAEKIIKPPQTYNGKTVAYVQQTLLPANRAEALFAITGRGLSTLGQDLFNVFIYEMLPRSPGAISSPQLHPANANFLADYQHFLQYVQVKRFGTDTELDEFKAKYLADLSADAQEDLLDEYNKVINDILVVDSAVYEHVNSASLVNKLAGVEHVAATLAESFNELTPADISIINHYAYLLSDQQIPGLVQQLSTTIKLQEFTDVQQLIGAEQIKIWGLRIGSQVMLCILTLPTAREWLTNHVTAGGSELVSLINALPQDASLGFLQQLGLDWVKNKITYGSQLASIIGELPQDVRLGFLQQFGVDWVKDKMTDGQQLVFLIEALPQDATSTLEFVQQQLGLDWIKGKIANGSQLASLIRALPLDARLEFLQQQLGLDWVKDKIAAGWQLDSLIGALPQDVRVGLLQQLKLDWVKDKIANGWQLGSLISALPQDARLGFVQQLGLDWVKDKIADGDQLASLLHELPQYARLGFLQQQLGLDWVKEKIVNGSQLAHLLHELPQDARLGFLQQQLGLDWIKNRHYTDANIQQIVRLLPPAEQATFTAALTSNTAAPTSNTPPPTNRQSLFQQLYNRIAGRSRNAAPTPETPSAQPNTDPNNNRRTPSSHT